MSGHPSHRRFSREEFARIREMTMSPRQILTSLRQSNINLQAISRSIYNVMTKIRKESLQGRSMIQALFEELGQGEFLYDVKHDHEGHLTHLFIAHPSSIMLTKNYSSIFLMDCTYKTNKYKMSLLNIVGVTSFNTTFLYAVIFLQKEEVGDYVWALECFVKILGLQRQPLTIVIDRELALMNAIKVVFPDCSHLLCLWHIEKNIIAKCKKNFDKKEE
ncbi:protein FAR1-RELATED SEQUENCE 5-like [Apium graveolens]|uniref:protein FAR1-RELATED SEQUENCE 5-like n=1 Tax=Apium graveolens TaxID=4045 RepID=UPI003D7B11C0